MAISRAGIAVIMAALLAATASGTAAARDPIPSIACSGIVCTVYGPTYYGGYRTAADMLRHVDAVGQGYPGIATVHGIGESWTAAEGRGGHQLRAICLTGVAPRVDALVKAVAKTGLGVFRPEGCDLSFASGKPRSLLIAQIHAREIVTGELAWRWIDYLADGYGVDPVATEILDENEIWVVPVANPDGVDVVSSGGDEPKFQRKNLDFAPDSCRDHTGVVRYYRQGVDLERNFTARWGEPGSGADPCDDDYRGPYPASEPETGALEGLMSRLFADQRGGSADIEVPDTAAGLVIDLHSFGDYVVIPTGTGPGDAGQLRRLAERIAPPGYEVGTSQETVGYAVSGTSSDQAYGALGVAALVVEVGPRGDAPCRGFLPKYSCVDELFWPQTLAAFIEAARAARAPYLR
ncbi:M14 family zinc carboxypeptidase [Nocardia sp. NPDC005366]|uniref:M14 family zinc carboxypeptidase n=1 Tax=Nocardia sp. NPDC005366 TaxID=3156878 RepID=UPI0033A498B5